MTFLILTYLSHMMEVCCASMRGDCLSVVFIFILAIVLNLLISKKKILITTTSLQSRPCEEEPHKKLPPLQ